MTYFDEFMSHSISVIRRRSTFDLNKFNKRYNLVVGLLKCFETDSLLDKVINIIRTSDEPLTEMITLGFNQEQADYIYNMQLRQLSKMNIDKLYNEKETLETNIDKLNAILNAKTSVEGCKLYVTLFPCNECAKVIIQSGIKEFVYLSDKYDGTKENMAAKKMFDTCGIKYKKYEPKNKRLEIEL